MKSTAIAIIASLSVLASSFAASATETRVFLHRTKPGLIVDYVPVPAGGGGGVTDPVGPVDPVDPVDPGDEDEVAPLALAVNMPTSTTYTGDLVDAFEASGGVAPYRWDLIGPSTGVYVTQDGFLYGLLAGTHQVTVRLTDSASPMNVQTAEVSFPVANVPNTLRGWGAHSNGQIGNDTGWTAVSTGGNSYCGLRGGELRCWGQNYYGELGIGSKVDAATPAVVPGIWSSVSAGTGYTCGISEGSLWCWGDSANGKLGIPGASNVLSPRQVGQDSGWTSVSASIQHTCGIKDDALYCWGANGSGQLGTGDTTARTEPVRVGDGLGWSSVAVGDSATCGIRLGTLYCWGDGQWGKLGYDSPSPQLVPRAVSDGGWSSVSMTSNHACGLKGGKIYCWGFNVFGQVGTGDSVASQPAPVQVGSRSDWRMVTAGGLHTCGIAGEDDLYCWGYRANNRVGDGEAYSGTLTPYHAYPTFSWSVIDAGSGGTIGVVAP